MSTPTSERAAVRQTIRALIADSWTLTHVFDGEEDVNVSNETQAIEAIMAVDCAHLHVRKPGDAGYVFFVLGNDPDEVVCDYTTNLSAVDALLDSWY